MKSRRQRGRPQLDWEIQTRSTSEEETAPCDRVEISGLIIGRPQPADPFAVDELSSAVHRLEKLHIERILRLTPDKREAARRLGIGLSSLYRKLGEGE